MGANLAHILHESFGVLLIGELCMFEPDIDWSHGHTVPILDSPLNLIGFQLQKGV